MILRMILTLWAEGLQYKQENSYFVFDLLELFEMDFFPQRQWKCKSSIYNNDHMMSKY